VSPAQAAERRASHQRVFTNAALVGVLATAAKLEPVLVETRDQEEQPDRLGRLADFGKRRRSKSA